MSTAHKGAIETTARGCWTSRVGLVAAAAGAAIGPGGIWRFPVVAAGHGGSALIVVYLAVVASLGLSLVVAELAIGRATQRNPAGAMCVLGGRIWSWLGLIQILAAFFFASSLSVVAGWATAGGIVLGRALIEGGSPDGATLLGRILTEPLLPIAGAAVFTAAAVGIVMLGVRRGIERASMILVPVLLTLLAILVARALTFDHATTTLAALFRLDFTEISAGSVLSAVEEAVGSLAIGVGVLVVFGSYDRSKTNLFGTGAGVAAIDALAAVGGAMVIVVLTALFGLTPAAGADAAYKALVGVFPLLPQGLAFGMVFMALLVVATLTSVIALIEPIVAYFTEEHGFRRHQVAIAAGTYAFLLGVPSSLGMGAGGDRAILGHPLLHVFDAIRFDVLPPLAALCTAVFVGWVMGRHAIDAVVSPRAEIPWYAWLWLYFLRVPVPLAIAWVLIAPLVR